MYVYQADLYCDACGRQIRSDLDQVFAENEVSPGTDEDDSDRYPQWADDDDETDSPTHCASGAECRDEIDLQVYGLGKRAKLHGAESRYVGAALGTLNENGQTYARDLMREWKRTPYQRALHRAWRALYQL
jgi:hypothetical protein